LPDYLQQLGADVVLKNYRGDIYHYPNAEPAEEEQRVIVRQADAG
jgi:lysine 2,3-aminomutase